MTPDQAAGLRRRAAQATPTALVCAGTPADTATRLAQALSERGLATLVIDTTHPAAAPEPLRNLFDWRVQLQRGELHPLPADYGHVLAAAGARAGEPELIRVAHAFDCVVFDAGQLDARLSVTADRAVRWLTGLPDAGVVAAFALCKTLSRLGGAPLLVWGDWLDYERLRAACDRFLPGMPVAQIEFAASEDAAIAMLAARMAARESRHKVRHQDNTPHMLHGEHAGTPANHG